MILCAKKSESKLFLTFFIFKSNTSLINREHAKACNYTMKWGKKQKKKKEAIFKEAGISRR